MTNVYFIILFLSHALFFAHSSNWYVIECIRCNFQCIGPLHLSCSPKLGRQCIFCLSCIPLTKVSQLPHRKPLMMDFNSIGGLGKSRNAWSHAERYLQISSIAMCTGTTLKFTISCIQRHSVKTNSSLQRSIPWPHCRPWEKEPRHNEIIYIACTVNTCGKEAKMFHIKTLRWQVTRPEVIMPVSPSFHLQYDQSAPQLHTSNMDGHLTTHCF